MTGDPLLIFTAADDRSGITPATRNGHLAVPLAVGQQALFDALLPKHYGLNGLKVRVIGCQEAPTTSGNVKLTTAIDRIGLVQDIDGDSYATAVSSGDVAVPATSGVPFAIELTHTPGASMDQLVGRELFRLAVARVAAGASEAAGKFQLLAVEVIEP